MALSVSPESGCTALLQGYTSGRFLINNLAVSAVRGTRLESALYQAAVLERTKD